MSVAEKNPAKPFSVNKIKVEQPIRYMHIRRHVFKQYEWGMERQYAAIGGITVAYCKVGPNEYKCAFTRANLKDGDHYVKAEGRRLAKCRLVEDDDVWHLLLDEGANVQKEIARLTWGIKEFRKALKAEVC